MALVDNFNDNVIDPVLWPASYGTRSETGGRARVGCNTGFNGYASASIYSLKGSSVQVRLFPPAAGGTTVEAWAQLMFNSGTGGTDLLMEVNAATGQLRLANRSGYFDGAAVLIPYSATAHAWLRIRESVGTTYWETSPDGSTWTTRRSAPSPAWVGAATSRVELTAHRDAGTADFAEFDDLAMAQVDITITIGPTRLRELATVGPTRQAVVGPTRSGMGAALTRLRQLLTLGPTRSGTTAGPTRTGTTAGSTRTGTTAGPTRKDRGA